MAYMLALMAGAAATPLMTKFFDKRKLLIILISTVALLSAVFYFIPKVNIFEYSYEQGKPWQYEGLYSPFDFNCPVR